MSHTYPFYLIFLHYLAFLHYFTFLCYSTSFHYFTFCTISHFALFHILYYFIFCTISHFVLFHILHYFTFYTISHFCTISHFVLFHIFDFDFSLFKSNIIEYYSFTIPYFDIPLKTVLSKSPHIMVTYFLDVQ